MTAPSATAVVTLDSAVIADERVPNDTERGAVDALLKKHLTDKCGVVDAQFDVVKGVILHALAIRSTSKKVTKSNDNWIKIKIGSSDITIGDAALISVIDNASHMTRFDNKLRAWARSHSKYYVDFYKKNHAKLSALTNGIEGGLQAKHAVAQADFLTTGEGLELEEQAALAQYRLRKLDTGSASSTNSPINLFQLGSGR